MHYYLDVLKKYAVFSGRSRRSEYWYFLLFNLIISIILNILISKVSSVFNFITIIYALATLIPSIAVSVRRMHDIGKSGWMVLINLIPIAGFIWFIILAATDSTPGDNEYGPNSKMVYSPTPSTPTPSTTPN